MVELFWVFGVEFYDFVEKNVGNWCYVFILVLIILSFGCVGIG